MEGASVHRIADELQCLVGQTIDSVGGNARQPQEKLKGEKIGNVRAVKKRLFIEAGEVAAVIHFLMYGSYKINERREDLDERLTISCTQDELNFYACSAKVLEESDDELREYDDPEADVLSDKFKEGRALEASSASDRIIADVLLDQDIFGGVGNIIKNEVLFESGIHPKSTASDIPRDKVEDLIETTVNWTKSWYDLKKQGEKKDFRIYRQETCKRCGSDIEREETGEFDRISFFCPACQEKY